MEFSKFNNFQSMIIESELRKLRKVVKNRQIRIFEGFKCQRIHLKPRKRGGKWFRIMKAVLAEVIHSELTPLKDSFLL